MKTISTDCKIKYLAIIAMLTFAFMLVSSFVDSWSEAKIFYNAGYEAARSNEDVETYSLDVHTLASPLIFKDSLVNVKTGKKVPVSYGRIYVKMADPKDKTETKKNVWFSILAFLLGFGEFVIAFLCLYYYVRILLCFIRLMRSVMKGNIFDAQNIWWVRRMGIFLLLVTLINFVFAVCKYIEKMQAVAFSNYAIDWKFGDFTPFLLGIIALLTAEIMTKALKMKEEQDLTI